MTEVGALLFEAPALRGLDAPSRTRLQEAGAVRSLAAGAVLYETGADADTLFVVLEGAVEVSAVRKSDVEASRLRTALPGHTFGEEAGLGLSRRSDARAERPSTVFEVSAALLERALARSGHEEAVASERRRVARAVTTDLLRTMVLTQDLCRVDFDMVLDAAQLQPVAAGASVFVAGDPADAAFLVVDGLVQLQRDRDEQVSVQAYLRGGDLFGENECLRGEPRDHAAVSLGKSMVLRIPGPVLRTIIDRNPGLLRRVQRVATDRREHQQQVVAEAADRTTAHVFVDLHRMRMARSLLVIDQDTCVRCGHCAWSCAATHDDRVARLVRRGDKVLARVEAAAGAPRSLLVPNSCQHCKNPACMIDCPTGAIGRGGDGDVFIKPSLCTGCGACAKACPWDNIAMAPRAASSKPRSAIERAYDTVAVKCDLCREHEGPACVQACPTGSLVRLDPERDFAELGALLGPARAPGPAPEPVRRGARWGIVTLASAGAAVLGLGLAAIALQRQGSWVAGAGWGYGAGWLAALATFVSLAYAVPKRIPRLWHRRRRPGARASPRPTETRSRVRPWTVLHVLAGSVALAGALAHGGLRFRGAAGVLDGVFLLSCGVGLLGALGYAVLPSRLARLEREGLLPEDLRGREAALLDQLMRDVSGRDPAMKILVERILLPYARSVGGGVWLFLSGRSLARERARLGASVRSAVKGRGRGLAGLEPVLRTVVELRAAAVRRGLTTALRAWLIPHILLSVAAAVLLIAHVVVMVGRP